MPCLVVDGAHGPAVALPAAIIFAAAFAPIVMVTFGFFAECVLWHTVTLPVVPYWYSEADEKPRAKPVPPKIASGTSSPADTAEANAKRRLAPIHYLQLLSVTETTPPVAGNLRRAQTA